MTNWVAGWDAGWTAGWLGADVAAGTIVGYGDGGVATLVLDLEEGYTVTHRWSKDITKFRAGNEQRRARNVIAHQSYDGQALLFGDAPRDIRSQLAQFAASGAVFLLAVPHEAISLRADATGAIVPVFADELALCDWAVPGQRVVVFHVDDDDETQAIGAVVQSKTIDAIVLDVAPGAIGVYGGGIMPLKHVLLPAQQSFPRYEADVESWELQAIGTVPFDYPPTLARLALGPITTSAAFDGLAVVSRLYGVGGNAIAFAMFADGGSGTISESGSTASFHYTADVTTIDDLATALESSQLARLEGSFTASDTIAAADAFFSTLLSGGTDRGLVGNGAALTMYAGDGTSRPVWHRVLNVAGTSPDGIHALTTIIDHGGATRSFGGAEQADWFRTLAIADGSRAEHQWLLLFVATVRGNQCEFWVPTWRDDLEYVSHVGASVMVADVAFASWWPKLREHVQVEQADGTITYAKITAAPTNGDGTRTLTLSVALSASAVTRIGWLERCRFENADNFKVAHHNRGFNVALTARVVP